METREYGRYVRYVRYWRDGRDSYMRDIWECQNHLLLAYVKRMTLQVITKILVTR
jgi:hypothetical protein